jgi:DNA-directed RNA polymerase subunit RPC12/RpoP
LKRFEEKERQGWSQRGPKNGVCGGVMGPLQEYYIGELARGYGCRQKRRLAMSSIDRLPLVFKCSSCGKVIRTTRGFLLKEPLECPDCKKPIPRDLMEWYARKSMLDCGKTISELEGVA